LALSVQLDDLDTDLAADQPCPTLFRLLFVAALMLGGELRSRHKAAQLAQADDQATFVKAGDLALKKLARLELFLGFAPVGLFLSPANGQHNIAVLVLGSDDRDQNLIADLKLVQ